jgi:tetratricopeptide (TPR) repeat protein
VSDALVRHVDVVPTVLDVLGQPVSAGLPGHSLRTDADRTGGNERPSYFEAMSAALDYGGAPLSGVLSGRDKYIRVPVPELYVLAHDAAERDNVIDRDAPRRRLLDATLTAFGASGPAPPHAEGADVSARLRSLGYVSPGASAPHTFTDADDPKRLLDVDRAMHEAVTIGEAGGLPEAAAIYARILAARPGLTAASRHLAFADWRMGEPQRAVAVLQQALGFAGSDAGIRVQLGSYLSAIGRSNDAIAVLTDAAKGDTDLDALNALGLALARAGRNADALAAFTRALRVDADDEHSLENLAAVELDAGRLDDARAHFGRAVRANPSSSDAHAGLALADAKAGDLDAAIGAWKRAVALDSANFDALYNLGVQLARQGRTADAKPYLEQFARTAPAAQYAAERRNVAAILATIK